MRKAPGRSAGAHGANQQYYAIVVSLSDDLKMVASQPQSSAGAQAQANPLNASLASPNASSPNPKMPLAQAPRRQTPLLLLAPLGQLSGDGQLRELIQERRGHFDFAAHGAPSGTTSCAEIGRERGHDSGGESDGAGLWYLPPFLLVSLGLGNRDQEGIVALNPGVITWLQLRFGGLVSAAQGLEIATLAAKAQALPSAPPLAALATGGSNSRS